MKTGFEKVNFKTERLPKILLSVKKFRLPNYLINRIICQFIYIALYMQTGQKILGHTVLNEYFLSILTVYLLYTKGTPLLGNTVLSESISLQ